MKTQLHSFWCNTSFLFLWLLPKRKVKASSSTEVQIFVTCMYASEWKHSRRFESRDQHTDRNLTGLGNMQRFHDKACDMSYSSAAILLFTLLSD